MFATAFIQSISFLLFACSARLLLPEASFSLTRRTVCSGMPVHLRPPRADARFALLMLLPIFRLRMDDEYMIFSAMEPLSDPTG